MKGTRRPIRRRNHSPHGGDRFPRGTQASAQLLRLCAALAIVLTAFCMKLAFPDRTEAWLRDTLAGGIDLQESLSAIGAGLRDVFNPARGGSPSDVDPPAGPEDTQGSSLEPSGSPAPAETPEPAPSYEPMAFPELGASASLSMGRLTLDEQLLNAAARPVVALENGVFVTDPEEDDAPPVPFGMTVPERADYTRYTLPFDYASPLVLDAVQTSGFGYRMHPIDKVTKFHYGLDIAASSGTPVRSFADGRVSAAGKNNSYGNYILVGHADGYATLYAHLSAITVKSGAAVRMGDMIGKVGSTGKSTGPHLHFELRRDGKLLNPEPYL